MHVVDNIERRMTGTIGMLSYAGKLSHINDVITAIAMYAMGTLELHPKVIKYVDKLRRCLWRKKIEDGEKSNS